MKTCACLIILAFLTTGCVTDAVSQCMENNLTNAQIEEQLKTQEDLDRWREMQKANDEALFKVDTSRAGPTECGG